MIGNTSRRGFLGSVIGAFMTQAFFAKLPDEVFQFEEHRILPYRMLFRTDHGVLQGTPILEAHPITEILPSGGAYGYRFVAGAWDIKQSMTVVGAVLADLNGRVIGEQRFSCNVSVCDGDQLRVQYSLTASDQLGRLAVDEMTEFFKHTEVKRASGQIDKDIGRRVVSEIQTNRDLESRRGFLRGH